MRAFLIPCGDYPWRELDVIGYEHRVLFATDEGCQVQIEVSEDGSATVKRADYDLDEMDADGWLERERETITPVSSAATTITID